LGAAASDAGVGALVEGGGPPSGSSGSSGSSSGSSSGGSSGSSSGTSGSSSGGSGSSGGALVESNGWILVQQTPVGTFPTDTGAIISGTLHATVLAPPGCDTLALDGCEASPCPGVPSAAPLSAGTLTFAGGQLSPPFEVSPLTADAGYAAAVPYVAFEPGQTLTLQGSGAAIPAFGPVATTAPPIIELLEPVVSEPAGAYVIPRNADLRLVWSGGQPGVRFVVAAGSDGPTGVWCNWDSTLGSGVIPRALLASLGSAQAHRAFLWAAETELPVHVGGDLFMFRVANAEGAPVVYQ
jgi:hypothetical protein